MLAWETVHLDEFNITSTDGIYRTMKALGHTEEQAQSMSAEFAVQAKIAELKRSGAPDGGN